MSDYRGSDTEYYRNYYKDKCDIAYTGEGVKNTSRMLVFCEWVRANHKPGDKILDVGCGDAIFSELMPEFEWYGIDLNTERAQKRIPADRLVAQDLMQAPYPWDDGFFDAVVCSEVWEHVWDLRIGHKEVKRLLKREGTYYISTPNFFWLQNILDHHTRIMQDVNNHWAWEHIRHYSFDTHEKFLNQCGFIVANHTGADAHFDPVTGSICRAIMQGLTEQGVQVSEAVLHKWVGQAIPFYSHTTVIAARKA
jgi:SAM-dependent methyltransferase